MERLDLSDGCRREEDTIEDTIKEENQTTVVLSLRARRHRNGRVKALFFLFLLGFFGFCVWLAVCKLVGGGQQTAAAFADFFIEQGIGAPK